MAQQTFPITLIAIPAPVGIEAFTFNQLTQLLAQYLSASVSPDVTFFQQGSVLPTTDQGVIFYSTLTGYFYFWSTTAGAYVVTGQNLVSGDVLLNYTAGDELARGYVLADGRVIDNIATLSANQNAALHVLFGSGALKTIPTITPPASAAGTGSGSAIFPKIFCEYPLNA